MERAPFAERGQRVAQGIAERGQRVFDARRNLLVVPPGDDPVLLHLLQMLDEHLFADAGDLPAKLAEPARRRRAQRPQDQHLPFPADDLERGFESATVLSMPHVKFLPHCIKIYILTKRWVLVWRKSRLIC